jgi:hypothetical protein
MQPPTNPLVAALIGLPPNTPLSSAQLSVLNAFLTSQGLAPRVPAAPPLKYVSSAAAAR